MTERRAKKPASLEKQLDSAQRHINKLESQLQDAWCEARDARREAALANSALEQALRHAGEMEGLAMLKSMDEPMMAVRMESLISVLRPIARLLKGDQFRGDGAVGRDE